MGVSRRPFLRPNLWLGACFGGGLYGDVRALWPAEGCAVCGYSSLDAALHGQGPGCWLGLAWDGSGKVLVVHSLPPSSGFFPFMFRQNFPWISAEELSDCE